MDTVRQMATAGSWVTALHRGEKFRAEIEGLGSMLALGDVMNPPTIDKALRGNTFDAVVCTVGGQGGMGWDGGWGGLYGSDESLKQLLRRCLAE